MRDKGVSDHEEDENNERGHKKKRTKKCRRIKTQMKMTIWTRGVITIRSKE